MELENVQQLQFAQHLSLNRSHQICMILVYGNKNIKLNCCKVSETDLEFKQSTGQAGLRPKSDSTKCKKILSASRTQHSKLSTTAKN